MKKKREARHQRGMPVIDPHSKISRAKRTGGVAQAVEHLLCKCKALNSNPSPTRRRKEEEEEEEEKG
jgi:hypothetical protein